jgi:hypothetical protein
MYERDGQNIFVFFSDDSMYLMNGPSFQYTFFNWGVPNGLLLALVHFEFFSIESVQNFKVE